MVPADDGASPAPLDRAVLEHLRSRFAGHRLFESVDLIEEGKLYLRVELAGDHFPDAASARVEIRWYRNDDFTVHYQEERRESVWKCRWDRHPSSHNARDHFHPPPDASRASAEDAQWPTDHRDVCHLVFDTVEERIETLWEQA
ncbi:hypothetical protein [Halobacterium hubeiense]|uniref:hypothetical protein n=1 Tax=Halobacterium hubeiense TaxID=1407499 RepID=UPI003C775C09